MRRTRGVLGMTVVLGLAVGVGVVAQQGGAPPAPAAGQPQQRVLPPEARYWMGVTTGSGMLAMGGMASGRPSMATMMKMATGGMPTESRSVLLKLGSTLAPTSGEAEAFHTMPKGAAVNKPIYLETPQPGRPAEGAPTGYTTPKGKISFYWGCGERAAPGQPVVLTFDKLIRGENDPELAALEGAVAGRAVSKPAASNSKTYGDWPNGDRRNRNRDLEAAFPTSSTLAGQHTIEANYAPKIDFTLADGKSFLQPVRYTSTGVQPSGAVLLNWASVARATGYSVGVMAPQANGDTADIVMWSSADRPATFVLMEDLTPAEVNRLVGLKAVLPPTTTTCAVPAEVVKATKDGSMLMFTAFGDEATFIHPARPADPAVTWDQEWFSRVSFKSVRMDLISPTGVMDMMAMAGTAQPNQELSDEEYCKELAAKQKPPVTARGLLGRALGRGQEPPPPTDPRCVKK